jgi:hypothetical protein
VSVGLPGTGDTGAVVDDTLQFLARVAGKGVKEEEDRSDLAVESSKKEEVEDGIWAGTIERDD